MENPSFTGPPKLLQGLIFFHHYNPHTGTPYSIFFPGQENQANKGFHWSSTVFTGRGLRTGGFPDV